MLILILHFLIRSMYNYITREIHGNYLLSKFFFLNTRSLKILLSMILSCQVNFIQNTLVIPK